MTWWPLGERSPPLKAKMKLDSSSLSKADMQLQEQSIKPSQKPLMLLDTEDENDQICRFASRSKSFEEKNEDTHDNDCPRSTYAEIARQKSLKSRL